MTTATPLADLAGYLASIHYDTLPPEVIEAAKACALDTVGVGIGAVAYEEVPSIIDLVRRYSGTCADPAENASIWGTPHMTSGFQAALLNGILAHTLELDDVHTASKTHIGSTSVPAIWAAAEMTGANGRRIIEAVVAAYETMARIGKGIGVADHRMRGWHSTSTLGPFGAAAGVGKILGLSGPQMLHALGMAGTQSSGLWAFLESGATSKKLHTGRAAENGLVAALMARAGMTGPGNILDAQDGGLYRAMSGTWDLAEVNRELGRTYEILAVDRKPYACCRSMQSALDAILAIREDKGSDPSAVRRVTIKSYAVGVKQCDVVKYPDSPSNAKFSMRYGIAAAYVDGAAGEEQFNAARIEDPALRELAGKIDYREDPEFTDRYPRNWGCSVSVEYTDGDVVERTVLDPSGSLANPMTTAQLEQRFASMARPVFHGRTDEVLDALRALERRDDVRGLLSA